MLAVLILSILILVHELGHFVAARIFKVKVEEFGLGIPPRVLTLWQGHETRYTLNLLPIGGFVKLHGENATKENLSEPNSFSHKSPLIRALILSAGILMNLLLGVVLTAIVLFQLGKTTVEPAIIINEISSTSPLQQSLVKPDDLIVAYRRTDESVFIQFSSTENFKSFIASNLGMSIDLKSISTESSPEPIQIVTSVIPREKPPENEGALGIIFSEVSYADYTPIPIAQIPQQTIIEIKNLIITMLSGLTNMIRELILHGTTPQDIAGPFGIVKLIGQASKAGVFQLLQFVSLISINLAVLNLLPFPALDGGRLLFVIIEGVSRRKINPKYETWIHASGMVILLILIALISIYDFQRFF